MAQITINIPDNQESRVIDAFKSLTGEENPTNQEILIVLEEYLINAIKTRVFDYEKYIHNSSFTPESVNIT